MKENVTEVTLPQVVKACNFKPRRNHVLITLNLEEPEGGLIIDGESIDDNPLLADWQYVIAAGEGAEFKPGDKVLLDMMALTVTRPDPEDRNTMVTGINIKPVSINGQELTIMSDNYILGKEFEYEDVEDLPF